VTVCDSGRQWAARGGSFHKNYGWRLLHFEVYLCLLSPPSFTNVINLHLWTRSACKLRCTRKGLSEPFSCYMLYSSHDSPFPSQVSWLGGVGFRGKWDLQLITVPKAQMEIFHFRLFLIPAKELPVSQSILHVLTWNIGRFAVLIHAQLVIELIV
jgi:hypothetical protein